MLPLVCTDGSWDGSNIEKLQNWIIQGANKLFQDWEKGSKYRGWMEEAGFEDITEETFYLSTRDPEKTCISTNLRFCLENGFSIEALMRGKGMSRDEVDELVKGARKDWKNRGIRCFAPL